MMNVIARLAGGNSKGKGGKIPAPAKREEASRTLEVVRDVQDRRARPKSGRTEYFGVRVVEGYKEECEALAGELSAERKKKITLGALMDEMLAAYRIVRGEKGAHARAIEQIAEREGIDAGEVVQHLIAEKLESYGKRKR